MSRLVSSALVLIVIVAIASTAVGVALDSELNVYAVPPGMSASVLKFSNDGRLNRTITFGGRLYLQSATIDTANDLLYVVESYINTNEAFVAVVTTAGTPVASFPVPAPKYPAVADMAVDAAGNIFMVQTRFITDIYGRSVLKMMSGTDYLLFNGSEWYNPPNATFAGEVKYFHPAGVVIDDDGNVYTTNSGNCTINKFDNDGAQLSIIPTPMAGYPQGITIGPDGSLYVVDINNVFKLSPQGTLLFTYYCVNPPLNSPTTVAVDPQGNVYIDDPKNRRVVKLSPYGVLLTTYPISSATSKSAKAKTKIGRAPL